ncbi:MAG TPA: fumarylacetoacetate hydrolase family protein [Thermoanaerobaculia bacterium]|jgi:2-keto-4-pentenoate hydratase/2-oxohepta-3-ene-1,7-dioic acid hydratase in catechol pathway|nr:fumarylacetoacetate hydrolase family protein [Thermoanaerobaculia bacterium]
MLLYRLGPEGLWAAGRDERSLRWLYSDPLETPAAAWELGKEVEPSSLQPLAPAAPRKIVGIGRNYREHAAELGNAMPAEPLVFLKATTALIGPREPIALPPQSADVQYEGEIALVLGSTARRVDEAAAADAILGWTAACDVTARDLQRRDQTFARAKSFDTFCPLGPAIHLGVPGPEVTVVTRVNGVERQRGRVADMAWGPAALVAYVSRFITLEPGDLLLTGTPAGVATLKPGDQVEVEVSDVGVLANPVEALRLTPSVVGG